MHASWFVEHCGYTLDPKCPQEYKRNRNWYNSRRATAGPVASQDFGKVMCVLTSETLSQVMCLKSSLVLPCPFF